MVLLHQSPHEDDPINLSPQEISVMRIVTGAEPGLNENLMSA